jgi:competence protein ComEA
MRTEQPTDRAQRRLSGTDGAANDDAADDEPPDTSLARWLPDTPPTGRAQWLTALRADPGRAGVIGLAVVGSIAVLVTVLTLAGNDPPPVVSANLPPVQMVSTAPGSPAPTADQPVVVSVVGLVHRPGLVTLTAGARVDDALAAAGGVLDGADLLGLNVARRVADGEQIVVGISGPPGAPPAMGSSITPSPADADASAAGASESAASGPVNLNTATVDQLDELPGVGPVTASAIVAWRDANGHFASVDQLAEVDGIGPARLEKLRDLVHV